MIKRYKFSTLVILRRLYDAGNIQYSVYHDAYNKELERESGFETRGGSSGGDYYNSTLVRTGHRFAKAILSSAWERRTPFTEAMRLLGMKNMSTLRTDEEIGKFRDIPLIDERPPEINARTVPGRW